MEKDGSVFAADVRGLPAEKRAKRLCELFERICRRRPDPRYEGKSDEEVITMIKRTREELWKEQVAGRR